MYFVPNTQLAASAAKRNADEADDVDVIDSRPGRADTDPGAALCDSVTLRKRARLKLALAAGCSREVPQHAVALLAALWTAHAPDPGAVGAATQSKIQGTISICRSVLPSALLSSQISNHITYRKYGSFIDNHVYLVSSNPADATRRRGAAACWGYHAEQRGCARAVSRADVTLLIGMPETRGANLPQVPAYCESPPSHA